MICPSYLAKADGVSPEMDKLEGWKKHSNELPYWSAACKLALLVQPSSAQQLSVFFRFYLIVLANNKPPHWKRLLKHQLCYSIIIGSDEPFVLLTSFVE